MLITANIFSQIANKNINDNMVSALRGLQSSGTLAGLNKPTRLAMFLAQTAHESMGWHHDREVWGPTAAQKRYEGRADLGNTQPGDGSKFRGYTPMQITGRYNTTKFYNWCVKNFPNYNVPKFVDNPALMNTDPWEGIGPIWYWMAGKSQSLNVPADQGDFERVTYLINGGYNGLKDRYRYYGHAALALMGKPATIGELRKIQQAYGLAADGVCGPKTAAVLHQLLAKLPDVKFNEKETRVPQTTNIFVSLWNAILSIFR